MNKILEYTKENRANSYFYNLNISEIKMAHRIMEYLEDDITIDKSTLNEKIIELLETESFEDAYSALEKELDIDINCSIGSEQFKKDSIETMKILKAKKDRKRLFQLKDKPDKECYKGKAESLVIQDILIDPDNNKEYIERLLSKYPEYYPVLILPGEIHLIKLQDNNKKEGREDMDKTLEKHKQRGAINGVGSNKIRRWTSL